VVVSWKLVKHGAIVLVFGNYDPALIVNYRAAVDVGLVQQYLRKRCLLPAESTCQTVVMCGPS